MTGRPTIRIERLTIRLPAGYEPRARSIARLVAERLGEQSPAADARIGSLRPLPVRAGPELSDAGVAGSVSRAIHAHLPGEGG